MNAIIMTAEEARGKITLINSQLAKAEKAFSTARKLLDELYELQGWKALGYSSWRACAEAEFEKGQSTLYRQLLAAAIEKQILPIGGIGSIPERILRPLAAKKFTEDTRKTLWEISTKIAGNEANVTSTLVKQVVETLGDAIVTGTLQTADGEQNPIWERFTADVLARTVEARKRQQQHINGTDNRVLSAMPVISCVDAQNNAILRIQGQLSADQLKTLQNGENRLLVTVWIGQG